MIKLAKVSKYYGTKHHPIKATDNISLTIKKGEFALITGPSGCGKTTLLNLIGGMTTPDRGDILVGSKNLASLGAVAVSRFRANAIGFVFQFSSMIPTLNVLENVMLPAVFVSAKESKSALASRAETLLKKMDMIERAQAYARELSAGQQRRVAIARALINKPRLLLCDEPTGDLDPKTEAKIIDIIMAEQQQGVTVLMATHNHNLRAKATLNLLMENGRILE